MYEFNNDSTARRLGGADRDKTFTGTQEQFWPDALPATTNDSYGHRLVGTEPRLAGRKSAVQR